MGLRHSVPAMDPTDSSSSRGSGPPRMRWNPLQLTAGPEQDLTALPAHTKADRNAQNRERDDPGRDDQDQAGELMVSLSQWMPSPKGPAAAAAAVDASIGGGDAGPFESSSSKVSSKRPGHVRMLGIHDALEYDGAVFDGLSRKV